MELQVGDRFSDETGEWEVVGHARVQRVGQPADAEVRTWSAHERISVKRA